jgi:Family of unknown function (DUF6272)
MQLDTVVKSTFINTERIEKLNSDSGFTQAVFLHFGEVHQDFINSSTQLIEENLISAGEKKQTVKRIFSILIEGLQNVYIHGELFEGLKTGLLQVVKNEEAYRVIMGNYCDNSKIERITSNLNKLNQMNEDEVKEFYLESLNNGLISDKGGAGLGFITMRMKSKSVINFHFDKVDDSLSFFTFSCDTEK